LITIQKKITPLVTEAVATLVRKDLAQTANPATTVADKTAVIPGKLATIAQDSMDLDPLAQKTPVQNANPETIALEVDPVASTSLADIQLLPKCPEKQTLSKEEKIKLLTKEHIHLWKRCTAAQQSGAMEDLKILLHQAQDSQKVLHKLIPHQ
jgi:hypothetical protein